MPPKKTKEKATALASASVSQQTINQPAPSKRVAKNATPLEPPDSDSDEPPIKPQKSKKRIPTKDSAAPTRSTSPLPAPSRTSSSLSSAKDIPSPSDASLYRSPSPVFPERPFFICAKCNTPRASKRLSVATDDVCQYCVEGNYLYSIETSKELRWCMDCGSEKLRHTFPGVADDSGGCCACVDALDHGARKKGERATESSRPSMSRTSMALNTKTTRRQEDIGEDDVVEPESYLDALLDDDDNDDDDDDADGNTHDEIDNDLRRDPQPSKNNNAPNKVATPHESTQILFTPISKTRAEFIDERIIAERRTNSPDARTEMLVQSVPFWRPKRADSSVQSADKQQIRKWNKAKRDEKTVAMLDAAYQTFVVLRGSSVIDLSAHGGDDLEKRAARKMLSSLIKLARRDAEWLGTLRSHHYRFDLKSGEASAHREGMKDPQEVATAVFYLQANNMEGRYVPGPRDYLNIDLRFRSSEAVNGDVEYTDVQDMEDDMAYANRHIVNPTEMWNARFLDLENATAADVLNTSRAERIRFGIDVVTKAPHVMVGETWPALLVIAMTPQQDLFEAAQLVGLDLDPKRYNQMIFAKLEEYQQSSGVKNIFEVMGTFATLVHLLQRPEEVDQEGDGSGNDDDEHEPREEEDNRRGQYRPAPGLDQDSSNHNANGRGAAGKAPKRRQTKPKSKQSGTGYTTISRSRSVAREEPNMQQFTMNVPDKEVMRRFHSSDNTTKSKESPVSNNVYKKKKAALSTQQSGQFDEIAIKDRSNDETLPDRAKSSDSSCRALSDGNIEETNDTIHDGNLAGPSSTEHGGAFRILPSTPRRSHVIDEDPFQEDVSSEDSMDMDKTLVTEDISTPFSLQMVQNPTKFKAAMRRRSCLLPSPKLPQKKRSSSEAGFDASGMGPRKMVRTGSVSGFAGRQLLPVSARDVLA